MDPIKKIQDFVAELDMSGKVLSLSNDGANTTLVLDKVYALGFGRLIEIDGNDYTIAHVDYYGKTVTVSGVIATASVFTAKPLTFKVGSQYQVNEELSFFNETETYPLFYLDIPMRGRNQNEDSAYSRIVTASIVICDVANYRDWITEDYQKKAEQLGRFSDYIFDEMKSIKGIDKITRSGPTTYFKYGELTGRNVPENSVFNNRLTGVMMNVTMPLLNCTTC